MIDTTFTTGNNRAISVNSNNHSVGSQEPFRLSKSKSYARETNLLGNSWENTNKTPIPQLSLRNIHSGESEANFPPEKESTKKDENGIATKKITKAPSSPTSHASFQERQPKEFFTPQRVPLHSNPYFSNPMPKPQRHFKTPTPAYEAKDDCASSVISSLSADDSQVIELDVIDSFPIVRENLFRNSSRIRSNANFDHTGENFISNNKTPAKGITNGNHYSLPPTVDRTPKVGLRNTRNNFSNVKIPKPQHSQQGLFREKPIQSVSTGKRTKQDYLYGTPPRLDRPSFNLRRGRSFAMSVTSDSLDSSFVSCPQSPTNSSQEVDLVGHRKRFTPKRKGSHRRMNSSGSAISMSSELGSIAAAAESSVTNNICQDLYESQSEEDKSVSLILSYNEAERRKVKNLVKEEIKYMFGNLVPKPFKIDRNTVDFSKKVELIRSGGYLT